jgi:quercetin dioxygenase-like cupin family protein
METSETLKVFVENSTIPWQEMDEHVRRKIMAYDDRLMLVKVEFKTGGVGALHQHPHTQITHIESGVFEIIIGDDKKVLKAGDVFFVPPNAIHGAVCIEAGVLIDVFSPMREDFFVNNNK